MGYSQAGQVLGCAGPQMQVQPMPAAALSHYTALAREAELLKALREACAEIEQWAAYAFRSPGNSQEDFERAWSDESARDCEHWEKWCEMKKIAGLPVTDLSPVECEE